MATVSDILEAIRALPHADQARLARALNREIELRESGSFGDSAAAEFRTWLADILKRVPASPPLAAEALDRAQIYDE